MRLDVRVHLQRILFPRLDHGFPVCTRLGIERVIEGFELFGLFAGFLARRDILSTEEGSYDGLV